jgi:hypothetical protein
LVLEDLTLLGNAAAIPAIIAITQFLKKNFNFKRKSEVLSLFVSMGVCFGWEFYYMSEAELISTWGGGIISTAKHIVHLVLVSCATWLSASKSYDFFLGEKRKKAEMEEHIAEKETLKQQVVELKNGGASPAPEGEPDDTELDQKVRDILEG